MFYDVTSLDPSNPSNVAKSHVLPETTTDCSALKSQIYTLYLNVTVNQNVVLGLTYVGYPSQANVTFNGDSKFLCANTDSDGTVSRAVDSQKVVLIS